MSVLRRPDDRAAMRADILDAAILARRASPARRGLRLLAALAIVALRLDLEGGAAAGGDVRHSRLLGDPFRGIRRKRRHRPAVFLVVLDVQAVGLGRLLEFLVVIVPVVAYVLDAVGEVVEMGHFVEHGRGNLADGPVDVLGANVDLAVALAAILPDFVNAAPAVGSAPAVGGYRDGRAVQFAAVEMVVEQVEHGLGLGYDLGYIQHLCDLLKSYL